MNTQIIRIIISVLTVLVLFIPKAMAQLREQSALIAKRYLALHGTFRSGEDLTRPDYISLMGKVKGKYPRLYDSIEMRKLFHVSKNRAYSPKTGLMIEPYGKLIKIIGIDAVSPAAKAGIIRNDVIRVINGVYPMHLAHAWGLLEEQSTCSMEILRGSNVRKHVFISSFQPLKQIQYSINNGILNIHINSLNTQLLQEIEELQQEMSNTNITEIMLDICNVIGVGELDVTLKFADEFIDDETEILSLEAGTVSYVHTSNMGGHFAGIPLKVNIDSTVHGHGLLLAGLLGTFANAELIGTRTSTDGMLQSFLKIQESPAQYLAIPYSNYEIEQCPPLDGRGLAPGRLNHQESIVNK